MTGPFRESGQDWPLAGQRDVVKPGLDRDRVELVLDAK
jgi:hypothetical protein